VEFESLANQHKDAVYRQMLRVCGNREDAEDVLIDALTRAWRNLDQLQDSAVFRAWLAQIARRVCWNLKSREALRPILQLSAVPDLASGDAGIDEKLDAARMKEILRGALAELPDSYRKVYEMRDLDELPGDEVARRLEITVASMKSRLHRARTLLRTQLDAELSSRERSK